jgi:hypothetical protein
MELPRSLAPWAPYLSLFPPETALALGPLVRRMASAVGALGNLDAGESSEPDGLDGVARRGPYERLMLSELGVAEEFPEEFLRRAAMGEHLFYRLAFRSPVRSRMSVALFDVGPNQLGSPRLAHLAALVVFARRAEAAGAHFGWGLLQRPGVPVYEDVTAAGVGRLLEARSRREASADDVGGWRARLAGRSDLDDFWLIGGSRLGRIPSAGGLSRLEVADPYEPESRRLDLSVRTGASAPRAFELELPEDAVCARLLRDPFGSAVASRAAVPQSRAPRSNLLFDPSGTKLFALGPRGGVVAYPIPNSPRAGVGSPKFYAPPPGAAAVAAGRAYRAILVASVRDRLLYYDSFGSRSSTSAIPEPGYYEIPDGFDAGGFERILGSIHVVRAGPLPRAFVRLPSGSLVELVRHSSERRRMVDGLFVTGAIERVAPRALAAATINSRLVFLAKGSGDGHASLFAVGATTSETGLPYFDDAPGALFGHGGGFAYDVFGLVAAPLDAVTWAILTRDGAVKHAVGARRRVVGVALGDKPVKPGLVTVDEDGRTIWFEARGKRQKLLTAFAPVVEASVSTAGSVLAYSCENGDVVAWSIAEAAALCTFTTREVP